MANKIVARLLETDYDRALANLDDLTRKARESSAKFGELQQSVANWLPKQGGERAQEISGQMTELAGKYEQRNKTLDHIRYALHYRRALQKAGIDMNQVVSRQGKWMYRIGKRWFYAIYVVYLKDGRAVHIEPVEVPRSLLRKGATPF